MKKILLFIIVFLGMFPTIHHAKLKFFNVLQVKAGGFADEDGDGGDNCDDDPGAPGCPAPRDCSGGSEDFEYSDSNLNGNITTVISYFSDYDGCGNYTGESNDSPGVPCGITSASISVYPSTGNRGDNVTLTASASVLGFTTVGYEIQQSSDGINDWTDVGNDPTSASFTYTIDETGTSYFRVIASCACSVDVNSLPATFTVTCGVTNTAFSISSTSGNVNDAVTLSANVSSVGNPTLCYEFQEYTSDEGWIDITTTSSNSTVYIIDASGITGFRVLVSASCGTVYTSEPRYFRTNNVGGTITTITYETQDNGVHIYLGYTDNNSGLTNFNWVQSITTNVPYNTTNTTYNDPQPPDDTLPYYYTNTEIPTYTNTAGYNVTFEDWPARPLVNGTNWTSELSLVGKDSRGVFIPVQTVTYGWSVVNGAVVRSSTTITPVANPSQFQSNSFN